MAGAVAGPSTGVGPAVPSGVLFALQAEILWQQLPLELGLGYGQTCSAPTGALAGGGLFDQLRRILLS